MGRNTKKTLFETTLYYCKRYKVLNNYNGNLCPDAYFIESYDRKSKSDFNYDNIKVVDYKSISKTKDYVILLLESPHKKEYEGEEILPAKGKTGQNIKKRFHKKILNKIKKHLVNEKFALVVMNSIRYQASLGIIGKRKEMKDFNWITAWNDKKYNDLGERLGKFISSKNRVIVINACTKTSFKQKAVSVFINKNFENIILYETNHPSTWHFLKKIRLHHIK